MVTNKYVMSLAILFFSLTYDSSIEAATGTLTEWNAIAPGQLVRDYNTHITDIDRTGNAGFSANTPWYTIDNRTPGPACALGHLEPATNTLMSWGLGYGVPVGVHVDDSSGRVWWTVSGTITGVSGAHVAFKFPGADVDTFRHFPGTGFAAGIITNSQGDAFYAEQSPNAIVMLSPDGDLKRWTLPLDKVQNPRYLAFDKSEANLYFTTAFSRTINRLNIATGTLTTWPYPTTARSSRSILDAFGIFLEKDDAIWYADTLGNKIGRLNPTTNTIAEYVKTGMSQPTFIVVSSINKIFISERSGNAIDIMDPSPDTSTIVTPSTTVVTAEQITVVPVDFDRTRISRVITPTVTEITGIDGLGITQFPMPTTNSEPIGMTDVVETVDAAGKRSFGIFGDEFSFSSSKVFFFESGIISPNPSLTPSGITNPVNTTHSVTASLFSVDGDGIPIPTSPLPNENVTIEVISGPNIGTNGVVVTDSNGQATFTYTGSGGEGVDRLRAGWASPTGTVKYSNIVTHQWIAVVTTKCDVDGNGVIDKADIGAIFLARGSAATGPDDPRDFDSDGLITVNDARACVLLMN